MLRVMNNSSIQRGAAPPAAPSAVPPRENRGPRGPRGPRSLSDSIFRAISEGSKEFKASGKDFGAVFNTLKIATKVSAFSLFIQRIEQLWKIIFKHGPSLGVEKIGSVKFNYALLSVISSVLQLSIYVFGSCLVGGSTIDITTVMIILLILLIATHFCKNLCVEKKTPLD